MVAAVWCTHCNYGDIRLQGGNTTSGRLEICNRNVWGTVCDDFWDAVDAEVACTQLGFEINGRNSISPLVTCSFRTKAGHVHAGCAAHSFWEWSSIQALFWPYQRESTVANLIDTSRECSQLGHIMSMKTGYTIHMFQL